MLRNLLRLLLVPLPWLLKRPALQFFFGYELHPTAAIGLSWIFPKELIMGPHSSIGHGNVAIHLQKVQMGAYSSIARGNWITGYPVDGGKHFSHQNDRAPELVLGEYAAITKNHHFDCTHRIAVGAYSTVAGYGSQFLTHSIDVIECHQDSKPIVIGDYAFVGTDCTLLGGAALPARSVLGAKSLLNKAWQEEYQLYAGVPAKPVKSLPNDAKYFHRTTGFVE